MVFMSAFKTVFSSNKTIISLSSFLANALYKSTKQKKADLEYLMDFLHICLRVNTAFEIVSVLIPTIFDRYVNIAHYSFLDFVYNTIMNYELRNYKMEINDS